jgi:hypothetical protein
VAGEGPALPAPTFTTPGGHPAAGVNVFGRQCEITLEAPFSATNTCPEGLQAEGDTCVKKTFEPTTIECSLGATELCFPTESVPSLIRCPQGFMLQGESCAKQEAVPKKSFCGAGTIQGPGGCMRVAPAVQRCAAGLTLSGDVCIGTETVQPTVQVTMTCQGKNCFRH